MLRAIALCAPAELLDPSTALAQAANPAILKADIPAQPLARALAAFARQTGLQLVYVSDLLGDQRSHAVAAGLGANEALTVLLEGTGVRFEYLTANSVRLFSAAPAAEITVKTVATAEPSDIVITANRSEQKLQDVPITVQAISGEQLQQLRVSTFADLLTQLSNLTSSANGPGTGNIFIRGLGSVGTGNQGESTTAPFPNVALYLDEQSMQFPARNNDVYLVDMERVEVLEGPQGTLLGGGAEAGAIRYITNKPRLDATTGEVNAGYGFTSGGAPNASLNATLNLPLIPDTLAVRAVIFSDHEGGYIANVPGTISFNLPSNYLTGAGYCTPPAVSTSCNSPYARLISPVANNANLVGSNTNPVTYGGLRLSGLYRIDDEWSLLIQQSYQDMDAEGYFYAYPFDPNGNALKPDQITAFAPAYNKDRYESTAWTLKGEFEGGLKVLYTGSYLTRHIEAQQDYSNYLRSVTGSYYACIGPGADYFNPPTFPALTGKKLECYAPVATWHDGVQHSHQSHELRVSTDETLRVRALFGAYWEKFVIDDNMNWNYLTIPECSPANLASALSDGPACLSAVGPLPGTWASDPGLRENMNNAFGEDVQRGYTQHAFFTSFDLDIVPKLLTLGAGTRRYQYDEFEHGSEWNIETDTALVLDHPNGTCTAAGRCGLPIDFDKSESGFASRANLTWHIAPDVMTYYTFSQGFRPGGFNRFTRAHAPYCGPASTDPRCLPGGDLFGVSTFQYLSPAGFNSDHLNNNELGLRSELLDRKVLLSTSAYHMQWRDVQTFVYDESHIAENPINANGPSYSISGLELQLAARATEELTLQGSASWNRANQTNAPCLTSAGVTAATPNNPTPAGQCITLINGLPYTNPYGALDTTPPYSPALTFNVRARYEFAYDGYKPFAWLGASHIASMRNEPENFPDGNSTAENPPTTPYLKYTIPGYTVYQAGVGVAKDRWRAGITGSNLANSDAATNISSSQFIKAEVPLRPRVVMAQFSYTF